MRNHFAVGLYTSREGEDFKNSSKVRSLIACQSAFSRGHSIVSGINCALKTLPLLCFLFVRLPPDIDSSACFRDNMINYISHVANARNI